MSSEGQIKQWLKEGTITQEQAEKMLLDSSQEKQESKSSKFIAIIATIGAILIFVGLAWLIAKNWHQIPNIIKVLILVGSTLSAFIFGVILRQNNHDSVGKSLITLGALLYILSLFLISQIYHLATSTQHYAWLLLLAWTVIFLTAYFLDSRANLVVSMLVFFNWVILQYFSSISKINSSSSGGFILNFILIFLSAGMLLFGLSALHKSLNHKFTNTYRFWTVFYFLLIFYILSFQLVLPVLSEYSFEGGAFSIFFIVFILLCLLGFIIGTLFAASKNSLSIKEVAAFLGILIILFVLILSTKAGEGLMGTCYAKTCYDFKISSECASAPNPLVCEWKENSCRQINCYNFRTESECNSAPPRLNCTWANNYCLGQERDFGFESSTYKMCSEYNNQKENCLRKPLCKWQTSYGFFSRGLPTILWFLWIVNNFVFIGFILLVIWYGQNIGSTKIINLGLIAFTLEIITRYIGFWMDLRGYFAFSILAIFGGLILILGAWLIPKWRRKIIEKTKQI